MSVIVGLIFGVGLYTVADKLIVPVLQGAYKGAKDAVKELREERKQNEEKSSEKAES